MIYDTQLPNQKKKKQGEGEGVPNIIGQQTVPKITKSICKASTFPKFSPTPNHEKTTHKYHKKNHKIHEKTKKRNATIHTHKDTHLEVISGHVPSEVGHVQHASRGRAARLGRRLVGLGRRPRPPPSSPRSRSGGRRRATAVAVGLLICVR